MGRPLVWPQIWPDSASTPQATCFHKFEVGDKIKNIALFLLSTFLVSVLLELYEEDAEHTSVKRPFSS
jgi:hypothetical protein